PAQHDVLATLWARTRVEDLMSQDLTGAQQGRMKDDVKKNIVQLGLDYRLMTQFTSFVAVEEMVVTDGGQPRRIDVPVEVPEGVNRKMAYGDEERPRGTLGLVAGRANRKAMVANAAPMVTLRSVDPAKVPSTTSVTSSGIGSGSGGGFG